MRKDPPSLRPTLPRVILQTARLWPAAALMLAACATPAPPRPAAPPPPPPPPPGLTRIIGATAPAVTAVLGHASRDAREGPARLMQFIRPPCILDIYLYPGPAGAHQVRTAAARRADGSPLDPAACLALIAPPAAN